MFCLLNGLKYCVENEIDHTIEFFAPENPILESKITLLRALDQKLLWKTGFGVMAENVSSPRTLHVHVACNIFAECCVPEYHLTSS